MRIKKAALLAAASATLVLAGAGSAAAYGAPTGGYGRSASSDGDLTLIFQSNECETTTGDNWSNGWLGDGGDINNTTNCINSVGG
ncbi:hypothetical protein [Streptomyces coffeae]|uniref:Secreted protein n=1 Tax=Streptomyces coffeae TaxID=621382 RepID=A0ABS1NIT2_9ACTN|nr:hypothetical protein [Streptomyces coffeae]MBL1100032.1 hypothetical protein [Streptomyces coffeae]